MSNFLHTGTEFALPHVKKMRQSKEKLIIKKTQWVRNRENKRKIIITMKLYQLLLILFISVSALSTQTDQTTDLIDVLDRPNYLRFFFFNKAVWRSPDRLMWYWSGKKNLWLISLRSSICWKHWERFTKECYRWAWKCYKAIYHFYKGCCRHK